MRGAGRGAAVSAVLLVGCVGSEPWAVDTSYVIEDIDAATERRLERAFTADGERYGFRVVRRTADGGGAFEFLLTCVDDLATLRDVHETIRRVSESARVPVVWQRSAMTFASVSGRGNTEIHVVGTATPGADVILDVGASTLRTAVDADGRFAAAVGSNGKLSARGGWIYGLIRKGNVRQYIRMNVLDTDACERIRVEDLPRDSLLWQQ